MDILAFSVAQGAARLKHASFWQWVTFHGPASGEKASSSHFSGSAGIDDSVCRTGTVKAAFGCYGSENADIPALYLQKRNYDEDSARTDAGPHKVQKPPKMGLFCQKGFSPN